MPKILIIFLSAVLTLNAQTNYSLSFDGADDYVAINSSPELSGLSQFTLNLWLLKPSNSNVSNVESIVNKLGSGGQNGSNYEFDFYGEWENNIGMGIKTTENNTFAVGIPGSSLELDQWLNVAITYDGEYMRSYLDGELMNTTSAYGTLLTTSEPINIGSVLGVYYFDGNIDEISFWNVALAESQIQSYMTVSPTGNESGLVGYWNFNEGSGSTLTDQTSNGNNGTINGATWSTDTPGPVTYYVATDGSDDNDGMENSPFATIQHGIDAASEGDTVLVSAGTYVENINYNGKSIVVQGENRETTIIDGNQDGGVVTFTSGEDLMAVLTGFTIQNGSNFNGGGIYCLGSSPSITDCIISANVGVEGAGIKCANASSPSITNCIISGNTASGNGGGICSPNSLPVITNCTITGNIASNGAGIFLYFSNPTITNCTISENDAIGDGGENGGGGIHCDSSSPSITDCIISGNTTSYGGGGIYCNNSSSPVIANSTVSGNTASVHGGGIDSYNSCSPTIINSTISENTASWGGGVWTLSSPTITNCTIAGNTATSGGGAIESYSSSSYPIITNCTITGNTAPDGGIRSRDAFPTIANCILWNDSPGEIYVYSGDYPSVTYSDIQGSYEGTGNIDADPLFVDSDNGNYNLTSTSPCIDAGDPGSDLNSDGTVSDMGAYYYDQSTPPAGGNHSLSFDGVDDYVNLDNQVNVAGDFTIFAYINISNSYPEQVHTIIGKSDETWSSNGAAKGYMLEVYNNVLHFGYRTDNGGSWSNVNSAVNIEYNQWYHIAVKRSGSEIELFVDGVTVGNGTFSGDITFSDNFNTYLGRWWNGDGGFMEDYHFEGFMDEVSVWNSSLTQEEIQSYMTTAPTGNESGLVGYWNFNEGSGTTLTDQTSNSNNGTIYGASWSTDVPPLPSLTSITIDGTSGYRFLSSPVSGAIYGDLLDELWTQGSAGSDMPESSPNVWTWNNSWNAITDLDNTAFMAGQGMVVYVYADTDFDGTDDLPVTLTVDGTQNTSPVTIATNANSWNLLGNPYGLALDVNQLLTDNSVFNSTVYLYDNELTAYKTHNGVIGDLAEGLISPFSGFWIQAGADGNSFEFTEESIVNSYGSAGRSTTDDSTGSAVFTFHYQEHSSSVYLSFSPEGHINLDPADASRLLPMEARSHLTSMIHESGKSLSINNLPFDLSTDISMDMDVMILSPVEGGYTTQEQDVIMEWDLSNIPEGMVFTLLDNTTGQTIDLDASETANITLPNKGILSLESSGFMGTYPELGQSQFILTIQAATTATDADPVPDVFALHRAYPNPFNPSTLIGYDLPRDSHVSLEIFDLNGRSVKTLINGYFRAGKHQVAWNADQISSGIYLVRLVTGKKVFNQKITYLK